MSVGDCSTAKELWKNLEELHDLDSIEYQADVTRDLVNLRFIPGDDPKIFLESFATLMLKAKAVGIVLTDETRSGYFTNALHSSYSHVKSEWRSLETSKRTYMALRSLFNKMMAELERDRERDGIPALFIKGRKTPGHSMKTNIASSATNAGPKKTIKCWNCGKGGHYAGDCRSPKIGNGDTHKKPAGSSFNKKDKRGYANKDQGSIQTSNDLAAFLGNTSINTLAYVSSPVASPRGRKFSPTGNSRGGGNCNLSLNVSTISELDAVEEEVTVKSKVSCNEGDVMMAPTPISDIATIGSSLYHATSNSREPLSGTIRWILDLGATEHIVNNVGYLSVIDSSPKDNSFLTVGGKVQAAAKGFVRMFADKNRNTFLTVGNVFCLTSSPSNLLSHGLLLNRGWDIKVTKEGGWMRKGHANIQLRRSGNDGRLREIIMDLAPFPTMESMALFTTQSTDSLQNWHQRLGHMGISTIKSLEKSDMLKISDGRTSELQDGRLRYLRGI